MSEIRLIVRDVPYVTNLIKPYDGDNAEECSICISNDEFTYKSWVRLSCDHCFHRHCIDLWLEKHRTCPICVQDVDYENSNRYSEGVSPKLFFGCMCAIFLVTIGMLLIFFYALKK